MAETRNFGKVRVGIDWDGKGIVSFKQLESDPLNLIPNAPFLHSSLRSFSTGDSFFAIPKLPPDAPLAQILSLNDTGYYSINPYGAEFYSLLFIGAGTSTFTVGSDGVSTYTIPVTGSTEYTLWVWLSSVDTFTNDGSHIFSFETVEYDGALVVSGGTSDTIDLTGTYVIQPIRLHFTTDADSEWLTFQFNRDDPDATNMLFNIMGTMLLTGDVIDEPNYNAGTALGYLDDITSYVLSMNGKIGKSSWETLLFDEGSLSLVLNNDDKRFSPEESSSPYFGLIKPYKRVWVTVTDNGNKQNLLWSGWTHQFSLLTGTRNTRQATFTARQGYYNVEAQDPALLAPQQDGVSSDFIKYTMSHGYEIPSGAIDTDFTGDFILEDADSGVVVPFFSSDFAGNEKTRSHIKALQSLSELNGNYLWLSRYGRITFKNWTLVKDVSGDTLDYSLTKEVSYVYSPLDLYKLIVVNYDEWDYNSTDTGLFEMQGQEQNIYSGALNFPFTIHPTYNGKPLIGGVVLDVTSFLPVNYNSVPSMGTANAAFTEIDDGIYTYFTALANNTTDLDYRLSLISRNSINVWYAVSINQQVTQTGTEPKALETLTYDNPLITNSAMAETFRDMQVERRTNVVSWFDNIQIINKSAEAVQFIVDHSVGDIINLLEEQSGNIKKFMMIIGESFNWTPTYLVFNYMLAPTGKIEESGLLDDADEVLTDDSDEVLSDES